MNGADDLRRMAGLKTEDIVADNLQASVRASEYSDFKHYESEEVRQAVVHSREDIILLVSHVRGIHIAANRLVRIGVLLVTLFLAFGMLTWFYRW